MDKNNIYLRVYDLFIDFILPTLLIVITGIFIVFIIIKGYKIFKAIDLKEKSEHRKNLIYILIGLLAVYVLFGICFISLHYVRKGLEKKIKENSNKVITLNETKLESICFSDNLYK